MGERGGARESREIKRGSKQREPRKANLKKEKTYTEKT